MIIEVVKKAVSFSVAVAVAFSFMLAAPTQLHAGMLPVQVGKLYGFILECN